MSKNNVVELEGREKGHAMLIAQDLELEVSEFLLVLS
jgi:hypothetical protein